MLDLVAIAQSSPGPIAVNGSIAVGYKLCGIAGALVAIVERSFRHLLSYPSYLTVTARSGAIG